MVTEKLYELRGLRDIAKLQLTRHYLALFNLAVNTVDVLGIFIETVVDNILSRWAFHGRVLQTMNCVYICIQLPAATNGD